MKLGDVCPHGVIVEGVVINLFPHPIDISDPAEAVRETVRQVAEFPTMRRKTRLTLDCYECEKVN